MNSEYMWNNRFSKKINFLTLWKIDIVILLEPIAVFSDSCYIDTVTDALLKKYWFVKLYLHKKHSQNKT